MDQFSLLWHGERVAMMQSSQNYIDRLGLVKAELKGDQEPISLDVANDLIKRCQSTALLIVTATPKGSKGSFGRGERANLTSQGQLRAFREDVSMRYKAEIGPDHVLMGWMVRQCAWVVNNFEVKGPGERLFVLPEARTTLLELFVSAETIQRVEPN